MSRALNKLTDTAVRKAKFEGSPRKIADGGGLYLHVQEKGKYWRQKYRYGGKEGLLSLGVFPTVTLKEARVKREENKKWLAEGIDPRAAKRKQAREQRISDSNTFKSIAIEWHEEVHLHKVSEDHAKSCLDRLRKYIFPKLGEQPIADISAPELLEVLRTLEKRGVLETVSRVKSLCSQVFRYAIATERATRNPASELTGALKTPKEKHHPAIIDPKEIGPLLKAIDGYDGHPTVHNALRVAPYLFVRPGELRNARWEDFDLEKAVWNFKPSKKGLPFEFPLSKQIIEILKEQKQICGNSPYVFPSTRSNFRPLSDNTLNAALHRLDYKDKTTIHGFRAMARTVLAERLNFSAEVIEMQLGHNVKDSLGRAYNRTTHLLQRKKMMEEWAGYLNKLKRLSVNE